MCLLLNLHTQNYHTLVVSNSSGYLWSTERKSRGIHLDRGERRKKHFCQLCQENRPRHKRRRNKKKTTISLDRLTVDRGPFDQEGIISDTAEADLVGVIDHSWQLCHYNHVFFATTTGWAQPRPPRTAAHLLIRRLPQNWVSDWLVQFSILRHMR